MKVSFIQFFTFLLLIVSSCQDDDNATPTPQPEPPGPINLMSLQKGQHATYVRLDGICGFADLYEYTRDTLNVHITGEDGDLTFEETFTKGSPLYELNPDTVSYPVIIEDGFILLPERSQSTLFFFYGNDTIFTSPNHDVELIQEGCRQMIDGQVFGGDFIGHLPSFEMHDIFLQDQTVVSCVPLIIDLEAFLCYNDGQINLSYTLDSGFPGITFRGWKLLD